METFNSRKILIREFNFNDILTQFMIITVKDSISLMESVGLRLCECSPRSLQCENCNYSEALIQIDARNFDIKFLLLSAVNIKV